ncbi:protein of unknown function [Candidatus Methylocalor cossyra]|uniref:Uncharacterized protein n=1 Tax=Candidatus Methylocalor cossyra TaxID=3108543 RepID=A0ABP1C8N4_9GAMM
MSIVLLCRISCFGTAKSEYEN